MEIENGKGPPPDLLLRFVRQKTKAEVRRQYFRATDAPHAPRADKNGKWTMDGAPPPPANRLA
ncbi:hypothetical protein B0H17DRAFT_1106142 [Mycena rosella]|uniref:Uncharacterized protein n=1 Tax=Mycena rosella TaxID=1033263 RepID=A0AAD7C697_MYCRO|nr:hypothetical protein B0H17DRAFT_1106142 [Mycena rosella]